MKVLNSFPEPFTALIQGASRGIGQALVHALLDNGRVGRVIATCRDCAGASGLRQLQEDRSDGRLEIRELDVTRPQRIAELAGELAEEKCRLNLLINVAGVLHGNDFGPEKRLEDLSLDALQKVFAVNTFGPALMLRHFRPLLAREGKVVVAAVSARVGSIEDNRLGGWYAYRASKAALNQILKTASIEFRRRNSNAIVAALHPGTTDTGLSGPFQANVPDGKLFSVEYTSARLLDVIDGLDENDSGGFFAWDGSRIPW